MNNIEKFIDKLIMLNNNDELIINENEFFSDSYIKFIISNYGVEQSKEANLYLFAIYLVKLNNKKLNKVRNKFAEIGIDDLIFNTLAILDDRKCEFFCALIVNYLNTNNIEYKELVKIIKAFPTIDVSRF